MDALYGTSDPLAEARLRWFLSRDSRGAIGERSSFAAMVARLEVGGRTGGAPRTDVDERQIHAAEMDRHIRRALELAYGWREDGPANHPLMRVLLAEYSPAHYSGWRTALHELSADTGDAVQAMRMFEALWYAMARSHPRVMPHTDAARDWHARSKTSYCIEAWIVRLAWRVSRHQGVPRHVDERSLKLLSRQADSLHRIAVIRFASAYRTART